MTTDPLADALAELRRAFPMIDSPWTGDDFAPNGIVDAIDRAIATILNAALSDEIMPREEHLALMATANEAAAWVIEPLPQGEDGRYFRIQGFHEEGCCHKDDTLIMVNRILVDRVRALTTADQRAALDRMIQAARADERAKMRVALQEARDAAHSMAHDEYDGVWSEQDFRDHTPLADAALADGEPT